MNKKGIYRKLEAIRTMSNEERKAIVDNYVYLRAAAYIEQVEDDVRASEEEKTDFKRAVVLEHLVPYEENFDADEAVKLLDSWFDFAMKVIKRAF